MTLTKETVMQAGADINVPAFLQDTTGTDTWQNIGLIIAAVLLLVFSVHLLKQENASNNIPAALIVLIAGALVGTVLARTEQQTILRNEYNQAVYHWKQQYAYPYITEQDYTDYPLVKIKTLNEAGTEFEITYQDRGGITRRQPDSTYHVYRVAGTNKDPFVRVYRLTDDLGHGVVPGDYMLDVYTDQDTAGMRGESQ